MKLRRNPVSEVGGKSGNPSEDRVSRKRISSTVSDVAERSQKVGAEN